MLADPRLLDPQTIIPERGGVSIFVAYKNSYGAPQIAMSYPGTKETNPIVAGAEFDPTTFSGHLRDSISGLCLSRWTVREDVVFFLDKGLLGWERLDAGAETDMVTVPKFVNSLLVDDDVSGPAPKMQKRYKTRLV
eukprot:GHVU01233948.1.p1 GENE.GHVU01233948.1~~GHVU01233948.1.p1  ORF type:complete len:136 (+),score=8.36 GHVU01233948.1:324-731(+)